MFLVFEQIARADGTRSEGTELGLHVSQTLAAVIGGEITVESVPGAGSTFGLQFATAGADDSAPSASSGSTDPIDQMMAPTAAPMP